MTGTEEGKLKKRIWFYLFLLVWCVQMGTAVYFCAQKQGFHEDEYYSYYSTSRTYGLVVEDGAWMMHDKYFDEFVVLQGQGFQYGLVKLVQSWDVHPPIYYWILHTVCSLFPGQFSKWFGLVINLAAFGISMFLLWLLGLKVTKGNEKLVWLICLFYGFTPAVMSSVVFIRMYALLTVFVYLCGILHVKAIEGYSQPKDRLSVKGFLLPLAVVTYLGFLTQYYYFIFLFFIAAGFCLYLLWKDRNLWNCIRYGISVGIAFVVAYLTYPSCLGQMFRGQRGAQATSNFFDLSNTLMRLSFFWQLLDEYVFGKMLPVFLLIILLLLVTAVRKNGTRKHEGVNDSVPGKEKCSIGAVIERNKAYVLLLFSVAGYFLVVSKTALLLGNTSVRYQTPIYGMVVLLVFMTIEQLGISCGILRRETTDEKLRNRYRNRFVAAGAIICVLINLAGLLSNRVVFLYPEDAEHVAFAKEQAANGTPVIYLYDAQESWCVWDCANEFFAYDRIYFASQETAEPILDSTIVGSRELVVYISNTAGSEEQLQRILESNQNLTTYELQYQEKYCDVYYFH